MGPRWGLGWGHVEDMNSIKQQNADFGLPGVACIGETASVGECTRND